MTVDMSPDAILERLERARPPDLRPERRLAYKVDMSPEGISRRLAQVSRLRELGRFLVAAGATLEPSPRPKPTSQEEER